MNLRIEFGGHQALAAAVMLRASTVGVRIGLGLAESVAKLKELTEARSSGRPGPNIITGSYHDSWFTAVTGSTAVLSNFQPQALRLEFGFVGTDSLGRHYNQPPYAHLGPAVEEFRPEFEATLVKALRP